MEHLTHLNLAPAVLAGLLVERRQYTADAIVLAPVAGPAQPGRREVVDCRYDAKRGELNVALRSKSEARAALEAVLPDNHALQAAIAGFDHTRSAWQIAAALRERDHQLGLSPLQRRFFTLDGCRDEAQQNILSFFLPYRSLIRGDLPLTEKCISNALQQYVCLEPAPPQRRDEPGARCDDNCLGLDFTVGGPRAAAAPCVRVIVGPLAPAELDAYVAGGRQRLFLEAGLLANLLPAGWEWRVELRVKPADRIFHIGDTRCESRLDIQSYLD
jgi:hypothetical protein